MFINLKLYSCLICPNPLGNYEWVLLELFYRYFPYKKPTYKELFHENSKWKHPNVWIN